jgi:protein-S-isoprenylcysteine O-methyltransferase Ste14
MIPAILKHAWWLCIPVFGGGMYVFAMHKNIAKRMADMAGYTSKEKLFTISASMLPYPFMIITIWTAFTSIKQLLYIGIAFYAIGLMLYFATLMMFIKTPIDKQLTEGPFRLSRNPMYVSATLMFLCICLMTINIVLSLILAVMFILQHFMILAEERACLLKYGVAYEKYTKEVPRYFFKI